MSTCAPVIFNINNNININFAINVNVSRPCQLDGAVGRVQRAIDIAEFNRPGSQVGVFMLSTRAGALGAGP